MKTLNEVIKAFSEVNKEVGCGDCQFNDAESDDIPCELNDCIFNDALHYLKEYQTLQYGYIKAMSDIEDNPPLSWDELKGMEGKPVWVEAESLSVGVSPYWQDWYIIKSFSNDEFMYCNDGFEWAKETQGRLWQAYRKERK